jgi:hypothetical protein
VRYSRQEETSMRADYDSEANALSIDLVDAPHWDGSEGVGERVNVSFADNKPVNVELLYPKLGIEEPLRDAAARYELGVEALIAAAQAAIAAPDRRSRSRSASGRRPDWSAQAARANCVGYADAHAA